MIYLDVHNGGSISCHAGKPQLRRKAMYEHDFCEYAVKKKLGGAYLAKLVLAMLAAAVFVVCFFALILPAVGLFFGAIIFTLFATLQCRRVRIHADRRDF